MGTRPHVSIGIMNGQLGISAPAQFGTSAILVASPIAPAQGYGVPFLVKTIKQATTAFAQVGNEAVLAALISGFFAEAQQGTNLWIMAMASTTTLADLLDDTVANVVLNAGGGNVRLLAVIKFPDTGTYVPTITTGFDDDVIAAVVAAQALADEWLGKQKPLRIMVEGYACDGIANNLKDYSSSAYRNVAIVVGNIDGSTSTALLLALGRAARGESQQNLGRIKTGSLNIAEAAIVNIGAVLVDQYDTDDLDTIYDKRYITFERNETGSGYVFNDDNMLTDQTDDYNSLRAGRVMDNITRIAYITYYQSLKDDVDVDDQGRISAAVEKDLESSVETNIDQQIRPQLSIKKDGTANVQCLVNPDPVQYAQLYEDNGITEPNFNILQTNTIYLFVLAVPKGCLKYINVFLGFTA